MFSEKILKKFQKTLKIFGFASLVKGKTEIA
jgi:hypothetical protein